MYRIKLNIHVSPAKDLKIYVYRSIKQEDVQTIDAVKNLLPVMVIDETQYPQPAIVNNAYPVMDTQESNVIPGVTYNGPEPAYVPVNEYEVVTEMNKVNDNTSFVSVILNPLKIDYKGTLYYYSIIGVKGGLITHLSRVKAEVLLSDYIGMGIREIESCDNYTGSPEDIWEPVGTCDWSNIIKFGWLDKDGIYGRFKSPFIGEVPTFKQDEITADTRCAMNFRHIVLRFPNPWHMNNERFNYRKIKAFRVRNICDDHYGYWSMPTFQSLLPVGIERLFILREDVTKTPDNETPIPFDYDNITYTVVRRFGRYYTDEMVSLGYNRYHLNENEADTAVYSEHSVQPDISINFIAEGNSVYKYTFYLQDIYGEMSEQVTVIIKT